MQTRTSAHGEWTSRWAFIFAATGAAVGLGNIWKFPYIAGENGGGAFVLMYLLCIALLGVPLLIAEIIIGRSGRADPAHSLLHVARDANCSSAWRYVGGCTTLAGFLILSYYSVIAGWTVDYAFLAAGGKFVNANAYANWKDL